MNNQSRKTVRGILVKGELVEITDPAEIAALERRVRAAERALAERAVSRRPKTRKAK
jgi:folate-dependent phosphoribosylglycinamide formyltransferase PurN